jgi:hypothetical protein
MYVLIEVAGAVAAGNSYISAVSSFLTCEDLEKGGFTVAVSTNKANPLAAVYIEIYIFKQHLAAVLFTQIFYGDHFVCLLMKFLFVSGYPLLKGGYDLSSLILA